MDSPLPDESASVTSAERSRDTGETAPVNTRHPRRVYTGAALERRKAWGRYWGELAKQQAAEYKKGS